MMRNDPALTDVSGTFAFKLPGNDAPFVVVASNGGGWDHVSVLHFAGAARRGGNGRYQEAVLQAGRDRHAAARRE